MIKRSLPLWFLTTFAVSLYSYTAQAELVAIVAKDSLIQSVSHEQLKQIYLGTNRVLEQTIEVMPLVLVSTDPLHHQFNLKVSGKNPVEWRHYWSRWLFTGKRVPPGIVFSAEQMITQVAENPNSVGYVSLDQVTPEVKVILHLY